jgi:hypothetical protein
MSQQAARKGCDSLARSPSEARSTAAKGIRPPRCLPGREVTRGDTAFLFRRRDSLRKLIAALSRAARSATMEQAAQRSNYHIGAFPAGVVWHQEPDTLAKRFVSSPESGYSVNDLASSLRPMNPSAGEGTWAKPVCWLHRCGIPRYGDTTIYFLYF